ncbi:unnamed protein product [Xylocopa violacea]|uniref:Uncharacterized protein n=1 Tax=Xylocopa violacea TaxID=135666 RepID=A0ABP1N3I0_XYLVO
MEIVIENPVESPPSPPPPPPPPSTSTPAATTVMTITIAENPTAAPTYPPPVRFSYRETYAANSLPFASDPYSARRGHPRGRSYGDPDGASPSVRRIDKSGLLGITEPEASSGLRSGARTSRFLSGANGVASGMLSPRRFECVGQLDPVPEVPGQVTRGNVAPAAANAFPTGSSTTGGNVPLVTMASMWGQERRDGCETLSVVNLARPTKSSSFDSLEARHPGASLQTFDRGNLDGIETSKLDVAAYASSFRMQENRDARTRTLGRLSRLALVRKDREDGLEGVARYSETCCNFPFTGRPVATFPGFEETSSLPSTRTTASTVTTSTTTVAVSAITENDAFGGQRKGTEDSEGTKGRAPDEERAEAEGCEHGSTTNPMKDGESSQRGDEFTDNDGIQTLHVIILSEQL